MSPVLRARTLAGVLALVAAVDARAQPLEAGTPERSYGSTVHARSRRDDGSPQIVLTARELEQRGAQNLKDALDLIPEVQVRQGGMGTRFDLRGAKPRSILLLIDGVPIDEPYYGAYEITSIPITDIVEIRVSLQPASPLEGPGGDGGIIEVQTLHATGGKRLVARLQGASTPGGEAALTGRAPLVPSGRLAIRASAGGHIQDPGYPVVGAGGTRATFNDLDHQEYAALRLEWAGERGRVTGDVWYGHRAYAIPPSDTSGTLLQVITGQDATRAVIGGETTTHGLRLAVGGYGEILTQSSDYFTDYTEKSRVSHQYLLSGRAGLAAHLDRPYRVRALSGTFSARLSVDGEGARVRQTGLQTASGFQTYGELAIGTRLRWHWLSVDAALGGLLDFEHPASSWPEAKLTVGFQPIREVSINLIGARKGRVPTLRELYDPLEGNPNLNPEQTWHGEVQMVVRPHKLVAARLSGYLRRDEGLIRLDPTVGGMGNMNARNVNLDTVSVRGFETGIDVAREKVIGGGLTYIFEDANSPTLGFDPIANFPRHRVDCYLSTTFWKKRMGGLVRLRWASEREVQGTLLPRYYVMELDAWARIWRQIRGAVRVDNLTNNQYQILPGLRALGTTVTVTLEGAWE